MLRSSGEGVKKKRLALTFYLQAQQREEQRSRLLLLRHGDSLRVQGIQTLCRPRRGQEEDISLL